MFAGFCAALAWAGMTAGAAQAADCGLKRAATLDMDMSAPDRIVVPVSVSNTPRHFAFQLADGFTYVSEPVAKELDLPLHSMDGTTMRIQRGGAVIRYYTNAPFAMGAVGSDKMQMTVLPTEVDLKGADGELGTALLANLDFDLDFAGHKLNVFSQDHCPGQVVYWTASPAAGVAFVQEKWGHINAIMQLDDKPVLVSLNTEGQSLIGMNAAFRLFGLTPDSPGMVATTAGALGLTAMRPDRKLFTYGFKTLTANGLTIVNPKILIYDQKPVQNCSPHGSLIDVPFDQNHPTLRSTALIECYGSSDVTLGLSVLSKMHMYFSGREKMIYLTAVDAH